MVVVLHFAGTLDAHIPCVPFLPRCVGILPTHRRLRNYTRRLRLKILECRPAVGVDIERPDPGDIHVVYLKYAQAKELVTLLSGLEQPSQNVETGAAPSVSVNIQADEQSNALIIKAEPEDFEDECF